MTSAHNAHLRAGNVGVEGTNLGCAHCSNQSTATNMHGACSYCPFCFTFNTRLNKFDATTPGPPSSPNLYALLSANVSWDDSLTMQSLQLDQALVPMYDVQATLPLSNSYHNPSVPWIPSHPNETGAVETHNMISFYQPS